MRRRKYTVVCAECHEDFHPCTKRQVCCSQSCAATRRERLTPNTHVAKAREALYQKRLAKIRQEIKGCKTIGDVWRLAYTRGYETGWKKASSTLARKRVA